MRLVITVFRHTSGSFHVAEIRILLFFNECLDGNDATRPVGVYYATFQILAPFSKYSATKFTFVSVLNTTANMKAIHRKKIPGVR